MLALDLAIFLAFVVGVGTAVLGYPEWGIWITVAGIVLAAVRGFVFRSPPSPTPPPNP